MIGKYDVSSASYVCKLVASKRPVRANSKKKLRRFQSNSFHPRNFLGGHRALLHTNCAILIPYNTLRQCKINGNEILTLKSQQKNSGGVT
jgi:hypothetical protein